MTGLNGPMGVANNAEILREKWSIFPVHNGLWSQPLLCVNGISFFFCSLPKWKVFFVLFLTFLLFEGSWLPLLFLLLSVLFGLSHST